jgi:hypothetical protein
MPRPRRSAPTTPEATGHLGRRSLVRTGVTAAWAVPVITAAAAAPAFAACSGHGNLSGSSHGTASRSGKTVTITVTLANSGGTTSGLALSVSGPDALHTLDQVSATSGWTSSTASGGGSETLTVLATSQLVCGVTPTASTFTVKLHTNGAHQPLTFVFTTASGVGYSFTATV